MRSANLLFVAWILTVAFADADEESRDPAPSSARPDDGEVSPPASDDWQPSEGELGEGIPLGVGFAVRGAYLYQFRADTEEMGSFEVDRFFIQPGVSFTPDRDFSVAVSAGITHERYRFDDLFQERPWTNVNTVRFGSFLR